MWTNLDPFHTTFYVCNAVLKADSFYFHIHKLFLSIKGFHTRKYIILYREGNVKFIKWNSLELFLPIGLWENRRQRVSPQFCLPLSVVWAQCANTLLVWIHLLQGVTTSTGEGDLGQGTLLKRYMSENMWKWSWLVWFFLYLIMSFSWRAFKVNMKLILLAQYYAYPRQWKY